ncbi:MAG: hypothetical protein AAF799_02935 [Myxococcota bacterium]
MTTLRPFVRLLTLCTLAPALAVGCGDADPDDVGESEAASSSGTTGHAHDESSGGSTAGEEEVSSEGSSDGGEPGTSTGEEASTGMDTATEDSGGEASTGMASSCGDAIVEGDEVCDQTDLDGATCESLGFGGGELGCSADCGGFDVAGCLTCGNGVVDEAEDCEGEVPAAVTCESMGFEGGTVACGSDCAFDLSGCSICGDGVAQGEEACDGADFGGATCVTMGFDGGALACDVASCIADVSGCTGGEYVQDFEGGVLPPEFFSLPLALPWVVESANAIAGTYSATSTDLDDSDVNFMSIDGLFGSEGQISFTHRESTEGGYDFLLFYMDGVVQEQWSGLTEAETYVMPVPAGLHNFEWRYDKDGIIAHGDDTVWVDDIVFTGGIVVP